MGSLSSTITPIISGLSAIAPGVFGPVATVAGAAGQIAQGVGNASASADARKSQELALRQLQQTQDAQMAALQQRTATEKERIAADTAASETKRLAALRRAVARQRAQFGAQGIASDNGSAEAVLFGLFNESDAERADRERLDTLRNRALDENIATTQGLNVLQRSQLAEQQRLERLIDRF